MSNVFSDTINKNGILQLIEKTCKFNYGGITNNPDKLAEFTAEVNSALDDVFAIIFECGGTWQFDDSNHIDYPIIKTNLVSGQQDYTFTRDEQGNLILDIYKVLVADENGVYYEIKPTDAQSEPGTSGFWNGQNLTGKPSQYDKTANGIFLDRIPNYNATNGLKIYINREASYFSKTDTTKYPGFNGLFHSYLALKPSYNYAWINTLPNVKLIENELLKMESKIRESYGQRERDINRRMTPLVQSTK